MKIKTSFICILFVILWIVGANAAPPVPVRVPQNFVNISDGGFGDSANSYSWGLTEFNGDIYVSTGRHHLYSMLTAIGTMASFDIDPGEFIDAPPDADSWVPVYLGGPGSATEDWADAHRAEIWRLKVSKGPWESVRIPRRNPGIFQNGFNVSEGKWERVHQSSRYYVDPSDPIIAPQLGNLPLSGYYPEAYAYRSLGTFNGYIYALGVGTWMPPIANTTILRSATGDPDSWVDVTGNLAGTNNIRSFKVWGDHVYVAVAVPGEGVSGGSGSVVYRKSNDEDGGVSWEQVSDVGFGDPLNEEIYYLQVFNGCLYASTVNYVNGFEVWKTDGTMNGDKFIWEPVIKDGFGDNWCQYGMHMEVFGDYLYIGTASGAGMVQKYDQNGQPEVVGSRATDIIRINTSDEPELVVGNITPSDGESDDRSPPLSGLDSGFDNALNVYSWHMGVYKGSLIVGTFDMTGIMLYMLKDQIYSDPEGATAAIQALIASSNSIPEGLLGALQNLDLTDPVQAAIANSILDYLIDRFGGGDLWQTQNGINWEPLTLNGLGNWHNYGFRRVVPVQLNAEDALFLGTANPFTGIQGGGCEVWSYKTIK